METRLRKRMLEDAPSTTGWSIIWYRKMLSHTDSQVPTKLRLQSHANTQAMEPRLPPRNPTTLSKIQLLQTGLKGIPEYPSKSDHQRDLSIPPKNVEEQHAVKAIYRQVRSSPIPLLEMPTRLRLVSLTQATKWSLGSVAQWRTNQRV